MTEPVSVVITCYNLEMYIQAAVQSVLSQDYPGVIQVIVVDDRSTDRSRQILQTFSGIDVVLRDENGGVMNAMISGLGAATHDVVFFLDGDDLWHPSKLSRCMAAFDNNTKLCTHDLWYMDAGANALSKVSRVSEVLSPVPTAQHDALISRGILNHLDYIWLGSAYGIRRSIAGVSDFISFCEDRANLSSCYQDWPLAVWVALMPRGKMAYVDEKLFGYRLHDSNYSGSAQTLEKLQRNFGKALETMRLIEKIMAYRGAARLNQQSAQRARMRYELLFATTRDARSSLLGTLLRNRAAIGRNREGVEALIRVGLSLFLGARSAHGIVETLKQRRAVA